MKILIVEDETRMGEYLKQGLREAGYFIELARNGVDGLRDATDCDIAIVNATLSGIDGRSVFSALRRRNRQLPVLCLAERGSAEERLRVLALGADDYLVKPFPFTELLARIKSLLRRGNQVQEGTSLQVADLQLDLVRRRATRAGRRLDLTAREFGLLEFFMRRRGEVLSQALIASLVWDINFDSRSNVVAVAVGRLRAKIDEGFHSKLLKTVRGMGYVLEEPEP